MTSITVEATKPLGVKPRDAERSKNFFALGLICWMYTRPTEPLIDWIKKRFANRPEVFEANVAAFRAGFNFGETAELFDHAFEVTPAPLRAGRVPPDHRQRCACRTGSSPRRRPRKLPLFYASYPITPASDILHELSKLKNFGVKTLQAEDEISAAGIAIGAAFAGNLAITGTSGPGVDLKSEALGLAVSLELPMIIVDVQRGGPSTGLPTKTEQADLMLAMYGRHGEAPMPIVAASSPSDCFDAAFEAARHRDQVPHAGDVAHRRLPRQRRRAVGVARRRRAARHLGDVRDRAEPRRRVLAVPARSRDAGAAVGDPGHARADAPRRRHREGRRHRQHQLRPREPRQDDATAGREDRRDRERHPAHRSRRSRRRRLPRARRGVARGARRPRRPAHPGAGQEDRARAPAAHEPVPARPRRRAAPLLEGARAGAEPRSARRSWCEPSTSSTRRATRGSPAFRSRRPSSRTRSWR